jgi:hypothetical protein
MQCCEDAHRGFPVQAADVALPGSVHTIRFTLVLSFQRSKTLTH